MRVISNKLKIVKPRFPRPSKQLSLVEAHILSRDSFDPHNGLISEWTLLDHYFEQPWVLSEAATSHAKLMIEGIWDGLTAAASFMGGKAMDFGKWAVKKGKQLGAGAVKILKKIGDSIADVFTFVIKSLPGGETVLEFLKDVVGSLKEKLKEMGKAVKDKVEEWYKTAKKVIIDFLINTLLPENEQFKKDIYAALGVTEDQVEDATNEMRELGINTITELNWALSINGLICEEEKDNGGPDIMGKVKEKTGAQGAEDTLKVLGFIDNPPEGQEGNVDPAQFMRGKAGSVIEKIFKVFADMASKNVLKYMQPLFDSPFFAPFTSGFGLAAAAFMGILAAGKLSWDSMVTFIKSIIQGFKAGADKAGKAGRAVRQLFTGDGAKLLKDMVVGLVTGSNIEVIIRALSGDPAKIADAVKRIIGMIMGGIKEAISAKGPEIISTVAGENVSDEVEGEVTDSLGGFVDDMFPDAG